MSKALNKNGWTNRKTEYLQHLCNDTPEQFEQYEHNLNREKAHLTLTICNCKEDLISNTSVTIKPSYRSRGAKNKRICKDYYASYTDSANNTYYFQIDGYFKGNLVDKFLLIRTLIEGLAETPEELETIKSSI